MKNKPGWNFPSEFGFTEFERDALARRKGERLDREIFFWFLFVFVTLVIGGVMAVHEFRPNEAQQPLVLMDGEGYGLNAWCEGVRAAAQYGQMELTGDLKQYCI